MMPLKNAGMNTLQEVFLNQFACDLAVIFGLDLLLNWCQRAAFGSL